ncbi:MAG: hypothetical protein JJU45_14595 [Acidimicrobiia bacterium]|nr:hypothetical protein [Acidimicrobiia bacterium]
MGKASSAKKVAKVARASGGPGRERVKLGFPMAIFAIFVLGTLGVVWGRGEASQVSAENPSVGDHWHNAYGIYICGEWQPPFSDVGPDTTGLHTHDDGLIHIHPFSRAAAGERSTWGLFGEMVGLNIDDDSFTMPGGETYRDGYECPDGEAEVALYHWVAGEDEPTVITSGLADVRIDNDFDLWTLAVVTPGTEVPQPLSADMLATVSDERRYDPETDETPDVVLDEEGEVIDLRLDDEEVDEDADGASDGDDADDSSADDDAGDDDPES